MVTIGDASAFDDTLKRAKKGDTDAITYLYRYLFPSIFAHINKHVSDHHTAEDLTQEVFETMVKSIRSVRASNEAKFRAWLLKVADMTIAQHYRSHKNRPMCISLDPMIEIAYMPEDHSEIREVFQMLTDEQKQVLGGIVLGYSAEEVGKILGKNPNAVRGIQHRAVKSFRRNLTHHNLATRSFVLLLLLGSLLGIGYAIKVARSHNTVNKIRFLEKHLGHLHYQEKKHHYPPSPVSTSTPSIKPTTTSTPTPTSTNPDATIQNPTPTPTSTPSGAIRISGVCIAGLCLST